MQEGEKSCQTRIWYLFQTYIEFSSCEITYNSPRKIMIRGLNRKLIGEPNNAQENDQVLAVY